MVMRTLRLIVASLVVAPALGASAAPPAPVPVRAMYLDAMAKEQAVRKAIADPHATDVVLRAVHEVVTSYDAIVRRYPASSYSDDALWNAARLELDAFAKFGQPADKDEAARLFARLAASYPASKFVKQIPAGLAHAAAESAARDVRRPAPEARSPRGTSGSSEPSVVIKDIRRVVLPDAVRITIELDGEVPYHDERIADPDRVFVDLPSTRAAPPLRDRTLRFDGDSDLVRQVRIGRHPNNTTRIVLDANGVSSYSVYPIYSPFRVVIDCVRTKAAPLLAPFDPPMLASRHLTVGLTRPPTASSRAAIAIADARTPTSAPLPPAVVPERPSGEIPTSLPSSPIAPKMLGGVSIARQLGLGVSRIVIDAGHGGHDPGAKGKGITEAELVLDVALRLEKLLAAVPGVDVILTRRTDEFIPLQERTAIANREGADLFLSIHANASPSAQARGIETYFLNFANNLSEAAVAARENAASGQSMGALPDFLRTIALNNKLDESKDFATQVQRSMTTKLRTSNKTLKDLGVKQAPFVVLIGASMPSVLAEISFVTNPQEAKLLKSNAYRQRIADALFAAIQKYQTSLGRVQAVAHQ